MVVEEYYQNWWEKLTPEQYEILHNGGTEPAFSGNHVDTNDNGIYVCASCGQDLFSSAAKFDSPSGWPSFYQAVSDDRVNLTDDLSSGMERTEVKCSKCGGHLGHVFEDGPEPTGQRYCINSLTLELKKSDL